MKILLSVVVAVLLWILFLFLISILQINGLILSKVINVDVKGEFWSALSAIGTLSAALVALGSSALAWHFERKNGKRIRDGENARAEARRVFISLSLSAMATYFKEVAIEFEKLWAHLGSNPNGDITIDAAKLASSRFSPVEIPTGALKELELALAHYPEIRKLNAEIISTVQIMDSRSRSLFQDVRVMNSSTSNVFSNMRRICEAQAKISAQFDWARFQSDEIQAQDPLEQISQLGIMVSTEDALKDWWEGSN